jgi:enoyl-CoA hydratase/carnithine racemase
MELLTTCREISATEALAVGLANTIASDGEGLAEGMRIASQVAGSAPLAIRTIKKLLIEASERTLAGAAVIEASLFAELWTSEDHGEAVNAFLEKREPRFKGR